jgi:hypothetical protein
MNPWTCEPASGEQESRSTGSPVRLFEYSPAVAECQPGRTFHAGLSWWSAKNITVTELHIFGVESCNFFQIIEASSISVSRTPFVLYSFPCSSFKKAEGRATLKLTLKIPQYSELIFVVDVQPHSQPPSVPTNCHDPQWNFGGAGHVTALYANVEDIPVPFFELSYTLVSFVFTLDDVPAPSLESTNTVDVCENLDQELMAFGDLLIVPMMDVYANLTTKTLAAVEHFYRHSSALFFVKTDDDVKLNHTRLRGYLESYRNYQRPLLASRFRHRRVVQRHGKWADLDYRSQMYPPFPCGALYVLNRPAAKMIAENAGVLKRFRSEDVSVGIWASAFDVDLVDHRGFVCSSEESVDCGEDCFNEIL